MKKPRMVWCLILFKSNFDTSAGWLANETLDAEKSKQQIAGKQNGWPELREREHCVWGPNEASDDERVN